MSATPDPAEILARALGTARRRPDDDPPDADDQPTDPAPSADETAGPLRRADRD